MRFNEQNKINFALLLLSCDFNLSVYVNRFFAAMTPFSNSFEFVASGFCLHLTRNDGNDFVRRAKVIATAHTRNGKVQRKKCLCC